MAIVGNNGSLETLKFRLLFGNLASSVFALAPFDVSVSDHCIAALKQLAAGHLHYTLVSGGSTILATAKNFISPLKKYSMINVSRTVTSVNVATSF